MIPVATKSSSSRPHTFGRSSNVWQYLDLVHDRSTPLSGERALSAFSESTENDSEEEEEVQTHSRRLNEPRQGSLDSRSGSKGPVEGFKHPSKSHKGSLSGVSSLSDLHHPRLREQQGSRKTLLVTAGLRMTGASTVNSTEIIRKLNALGTSSSAPVLPTPHGIENPANPVVQSTQIVSPMAPVAVVPVSDSEKLRNAFNSQATRLSYGCSVALELFNGHLVMVSSPDGQARVQSLEKLQSQVKGYKDRAIFTLLDLADVRSAGSIRYGGSVWLQLSVGPGDVSWEQGGVLGAKVREAPQLKALGLLDDDAIRNDVQAPAIVGYPVPVTAYLPKSRDDGDMQVDEIQSRLRNKSAKMLGKWIIRSAVCQRRKQKDNFVYNNDEVYLEQDWFYLGADSDAGVAVLRQLPPAATGKDITPGEYVVERRGAWKLRLLDSSSGSAGLSLAQQQMERLLLRAKVQLKQSQRMRAGQTKVYGPNLRGGTGFTAQLRAQVEASTRQTETRYADRQESRLKRIDRHLGEKARSMNVAIGFEGRSRPSSGNEAANQERETSLYRSVSVDAIGTGRRELNGPVEPGDLKRALTQSAPALPAPSGSSCALCHSSSIGYNLCCQFRDVIGMLEQERVIAKVAAEEAKVEKNSLLGVNSGIRRTGRSRAGRTARADGALTTRTTRPITMDAARDSESDPRLTTPHNPSTTCTTPPVNDRVLQLFAKEDAAMLGLIKYKEKEAYRALYDQTQPRVSLSPAAAYFRDRFKHVGLFMQMHRQQQQAQQQDGISGHFQKLHAELYSAGSRRSPEEADYDSNYDSEDDYADSEVSEEQCPPVQLPTSPPLDNDEKIELDPDRLFPTSEELEQLTPVDTKAALALYVQNRTAMAEMLDGYAELVDSQMIPTLKNSLSTRNRGALVETLDFVARASEFVCARRVQVFVAKLLHAVAESDVGDFTSFEKQFDELVTEMQGAVNFIRFFLQTRASRRKNKNTSVKVASVQEELMTSQLFLPLHPRRAQQLFQDVLLTDSELTPQVSTKPLPERLRELQRLNLIGIQEAKRGTQFQRIRVDRTSNSHNEVEEVKLMLTKDGSTLQVLGTDLFTVSLVSIKGITLHSTILHSFSLQFEEETGDNNGEIAQLSLRDVFAAGGAEILNCWVVALTCGVNAFQQQQSVQSRCFLDAKETDLVWQAVRLRIFELSGVMGMPTAIQRVKRTIPDRDLDQSAALRYRLTFLQCSMTYD